MQFSCAQYPFLTVKLDSAEEILSPFGKMVVKRRPRSIQFSHGLYETENPEIIELLLHHVSYNRSFFGPFSEFEVAEGTYKAKVELLRKKPSDVVPDLKKLAAQGALVAAKHAVKVFNSPISPLQAETPVVHLKAQDIIDRQSKEIKDAAADKD